MLATAPSPLNAFKIVNTTEQSARLCRIAQKRIWAFRAASPKTDSGVDVASIVGRKRRLHRGSQ